MSDSEKKDRLKEERGRLGLSQAAFGMLGGVSRAAQESYESGRRDVGSDYLAGLAEAGVDVLYILTGKRSTENNPDTVAAEMAGVMFIIESVLKQENAVSKFSPKDKAEMLYTVYKNSSPEERRMMHKSLEEGIFTLPLSVAKYFGFSIYK
ncbi:MAG: hypothetical protein HQM06_16630 [Magnetococcales bacterium]|nr:hypothetical protein [Magnetococcales bacterium]